jgi:NAD-dependent dihydropyrimidine dehydrogenase PreA subunit
VITIDLARCNGCGACVQVCPEGALYLVDDKAMVEAGLCRECESCMAACPMEAIAITAPEAAPAGVAVVQARPLEPASGTEADVVPLRAKVLPVLGAALTWAGREIVPRLADHLLYSLDRWAMDRRAASSPARPTGSRAQNHGGRQGGQQRRRMRRRGPPKEP